MTRCCGLGERKSKHPISGMGRCSRFVLKLVTFVMLLLLVRSQQQFYQLSFNVTEGEPRGTFVGNVGLQTGLFNSAGGDTQLKFDLFDNGNAVARLFTLDEQTGVIRTNVTLDREDVCGSNADCPLTLNIGVHKRSGTSGTFNLYVTVEVIVRIQDQNDNAPEFPQKVVTLTVPENMPAAYSLHTSLATDRDMVGQNSDISYAFETSPVDVQRFQLDVVTGSNGGPPTDLVISVRQSLDREAQDSYFVRIIASDNGSPRQSGSVLINIKVTDRNDNQPVFSSSNYTVSVNENAAVSTPILTVSAMDRDIDDNGLILYSLSARASTAVREHFSIGESDGKIYLSKPVDYETDKSFVFQIEAKDKGDPPQTSTAYVIVNITDVNDNAPEIQLNLSPEGTDIVENEAPGKFMGHISVSDLDQRDQGYCDIDDLSFRLDPFPGQANVYKIVLAQPLDHEVRPIRRVTIRCRDSGQNPLEATKTFDVNVIDVNDNAPRFINSVFNGSVLENNAVGNNVMVLPTSDTGQSSGVLRIVAEDSDSGEFGRLTYSIPVASNFSISPLSGILTTLVTFDREARPNFTFPVVARDNGNPSLSSTATVVVTVLDQNDHPPHFQQPIFFLSVREEQPPGAVCGRVIAEDEDLGDNAKMVYNIVRGEENSDSRYFSVHRDTGEITTNQLLDRETKDSFTFTLEVINPSAPYYKDTTQVRVDVQDDNDHDPVFVTPDQGNSSITLPNNTTVGSLILRASARDQDEVSKFEFSLLGSQRGSLFQVITVTGELILAREIRVTDAGTQTLLLVVSDGDSNPRSATATVLVTIPAEGLKAGTTASIMSEPNFIIIVVIVLVTLLVAVLVFTVICCIFRRDRKRRHGRQQQRQVKDKMYQAAHWVSTHALSPEANGSPLHHPQQRAPPGLADKNKGKKEVSFSLDEELEKMEGDPDTSGSLGSVFASQHGPAPDNNNLKPPKDGRFLTFVGGKTSPASTPSCYGSADGHSHTYHSTPIAETEDHLHIQLQPSAGEDALSASSGETATDSGRGGSEDEAHPNRPPAQETDVRMFPQGSGGYGPVSGSGVDSRGRRKLPSLSALPEEQQPAPHHGPHPQHPALNPQHNYFRSSAEQLPAQGLGYPVGSNSRSLHFNGGGQDLVSGEGGGGGRGGGGGAPRDSRNYHSMDRMGNGEGPFRLRDSAPTAAGTGAGTASTGRRTFQTFGPQHQNNHPAWRRARGLDGGWRSQPPAASFATTEDDDLTTTSGSYTLGSPDREEPLSDLSDLAFRQIRDVSV